MTSLAQTVNGTGLAHYPDESEFFAEIRGRISTRVPSSPVEDDCHSIWSAVCIASERWTYQNYSVAELRLDLETTWYHIFWAAMTSPGINEPLEHHRLINIVRAIRSQAPLSRRDTYGEVSETANWWTCLPFFEMKLQEMLHSAFIDDYSVSNVEQGSHHWRGLNYFAARLSVAYVYDLRHCAIQAIHDVVEEQDVITYSMMEVVAMWYDCYGFWLENAAIWPVARQEHWNEDLEEFQTFPPKAVKLAPGILAEHAGVSEDILGPSRWRFWRRRLQEVADAESTSDEVAVLAADVSSRMAQM